MLPNAGCVRRFFDNRLFLTRLASSSEAITIKGVSANLIPYKGVDAAKKPIKVRLEKDTVYSWCACGHSIIQPWCDKSCKRPALTMNRPVEFLANVSGDRWICMCKQTARRPFCDGSHKEIDQRPRDHDRPREVCYVTSPVYEGIARRLGYKVKDGHQ